MRSSEFILSRSWGDENRKCKANMKNTLNRFLVSCRGNGEISIFSATHAFLSADQTSILMKGQSGVRSLRNLVSGKI